MISIFGSTKYIISIFLNKKKLSVGNVNKRLELPYLLNRLDLKGEGVEVGVQEGDFSYKILFGSTLKKLYSIDPWKEFPKDDYVDGSNLDQKTQNINYLITKIRLFIFGKRSSILRMTSMESSNIFKNNSLDFVYIDANHSYDECKKDIDIWWKKVRNGGVLSGHDYLNGVVAGTVFGVKDAVDKFVEEENLKLYITEEDYPTWYLLKK